MGSGLFGKALSDETVSDLGSVTRTLHGRRRHHHGHHHRPALPRAVGLAPCTKNTGRDPLVLSLVLSY